MIIRKYSELIRLRTFDERYEYLKLDGKIGEETFGFDRMFNQMFYKSGEWLTVRNDIIVRDDGCDLGVKGHDILGRVLIHHMNPISLRDIETHSDWLLNPEYLILTILSTHNAIHYGDKSLLARPPVERTRNDMCPWRH